MFRLMQQVFMLTAHISFKEHSNKIIIRRPSTQRMDRNIGYRYFWWWYYLPWLETR